ncbi:hypothetical protein LXA43DRAFT_895867, partial [Ganoderma leucocontextum]
IGMLRYEDCFGRALQCGSCLLACHLEHPLHRISHWDRKCFVCTSLWMLGLKVQLGHLPSEVCPCLHLKSC